MKAMIFAAGLGTRLKPLTDTMPKALVPVAGKPLIDHAIKKLYCAGYDDIVINVHHFADMIEEHFQHSQNPKISISFSDEREMLLETGGGIRHAARLLRQNNPQGKFLIHNVDILSNVDLKAFIEKNSSAVLLVSQRQTQRYLIFDNDNRLVGWTNINTGEVKTPFPQVRQAFANNAPGPYKLYAFAGIHQMSTTLLDVMEQQYWPDKFSIIDFYLQNCATHCIKGYVQPGLRLMDVGKIDTLADADKFVQ